mmetsp:Transcript_60863/g.69577  ORF Transcript_60863/g.69577 Transcript_60863/m.69577 type:complete len:321 (+) Transcript_60863:1071-2033(+)
MRLRESTGWAFTLCDSSLSAICGVCAGIIDQFGDNITSSTVESGSTFACGSFDPGVFAIASNRTGDFSTGSAGAVITQCTPTPRSTISGSGHKGARNTVVSASTISRRFVHSRIRTILSGITSNTSVVIYSPGIGVILSGWAWVLICTISPRWAVIACRTSDTSCRGHSVTILAGCALLAIRLTCLILISARRTFHCFPATSGTFRPGRAQFTTRSWRTFSYFAIVISTTFNSPVLGSGRLTSVTSRTIQASVRVYASSIGIILTGSAGGSRFTLGGTKISIVAHFTTLICQNRRCRSDGSSTAVISRSTLPNLSRSFNR